jgi:hypothetical protein
MHRTFLCKLRDEQSGLCKEATTTGSIQETTITSRDTARMTMVAMTMVYRHPHPLQ